jgi:hypothetical protein
MARRRPSIKPDQIRITTSHFDPSYRYNAPTLTVETGIGDRELLYRVLLVSETVGATGQSALSQAAILGASERNNRRDEISSAMLFHEGQVAQMLEGMRTDVDRLITRLLADRRHSNLRIVADRPIVHRRIAEPVRLNALSADQAAEYLRGRHLSEIAAEGLERLLSCSKLRVSACAA